MTIEFSNNPVKNNFMQSNFLPKIKIDKLPSNFICYPENIEIFYTPLTLGEIDKQSSGDITYKELLKLLLQSITVENYNVEDLAFYDVVYIGIQRKLHALGATKGDLEVLCEKCGKPSKILFNFMELDFKQPEATGDITVTLNNNELIFSLLTIKDILELTSEYTSLDELAKMIKNKSFDEAKNILSGIHEANDLQIIDEIKNLLDYGLNTIKGKCKNKIEIIEKDDKGNEKNIIKFCDNELETEVDIYMTIYPFRESRDDIRHKIQISKRKSL